MKIISKSKKMTKKKTTNNKIKVINIFKTIPKSKWKKRDKKCQPKKLLNQFF